MSSRESSISVEQLSCDPSSHERQSESQGHHALIHFGERHDSKIDFVLSSVVAAVCCSS